MCTTLFFIHDWTDSSDWFQKPQIRIWGLQSFPTGLPFRKLTTPMWVTFFIIYVSPVTYASCNSVNFAGATHIRAQATKNDKLLFPAKEHSLCKPFWAKFLLSLFQVLCLHYVSYDLFSLFLFLGHITIATLMCCLQPSLEGSSISFACCVIIVIKITLLL